MGGRGSSSQSSSASTVAQNYDKQIQKVASQVAAVESQIKTAFETKNEAMYNIANTQRNQLLQTSRQLKKDKSDYEFALAEQALRSKSK